ncbi:MAG: STAS domain-containing protein [Planctomycetota bacterium]
MRRTDRDGIPILHLEGEFDSFETDLVRDEVESALEQGHKSLLFDLSGMTFANSTTLAYFIAAQTRTQREGGRLILVQPSAFIRKTLRTLGFEQVLQIEDDLNDALSALAS